jgi:mono/diheme cytochrome c family protein
MPRTMTLRSLAFHLLPTVALVLSVTGGAHAGNPESGKIIYSSRCAFCHGGGGKGDGAAGVLLKPPATNFTNPEYWKHATPDSMQTVIENGKPGTGMVAFKASINAEQIADLLSYLQTFKPRD